MKKGDSVIVFTNWDRKGTFVFRAMRVESWGAKRSTMRDEVTGEMQKSILWPHTRALVFLASELPSEESRIAKGLGMAESFLAEERIRLAECIERDGGRSRGYRAAIERDIAELHEPRAIEWHAAVEAIRLKAAA